jgi:hypothetical protein
MALEVISEQKEVLPLMGMEGIDFKSGIEGDDLLRLLAEVIKAQHKKITSGRIRDPKNEMLRLEAIRVLAYPSSVYNAILKDKSIDAIERRLEALENAKQK